MKMEYLAGAEVENYEPSDAVLQQWLDRNRARYVRDAQFGFEQIYLGADPDAAAQRARAVLGALDDGANWAEQGDRLSVPASFALASRSEVARVFGDDFAQSLARLAVGKWSGPVASGYGLHLVRVKQMQVAAPPQLVDVRADVENDWRAATLKQREAKAYQLLLDSYTIDIRP